MESSFFKLMLRRYCCKGVTMQRKQLVLQRLWKENEKLLWKGSSKRATGEFLFLNQSYTERIEDIEAKKTKMVPKNYESRVGENSLMVDGSSSLQLVLCAIRITPKSTHKRETPCATKAKRRRRKRRRRNKRALGNDYHSFNALHRIGEGTLPRAISFFFLMRRK